LFPNENYTCRKLPKDLPLPANVKGVGRPLKKHTETI